VAQAVAEEVSFSGGSTIQRVRLQVEGNFDRKAAILDGLKQILVYPTEYLQCFEFLVLTSKNVLLFLVNSYFFEESSAKAKIVTITFRPLSFGTVFSIK
jgi:hypothetical protein